MAKKKTYEFDGSKLRELRDRAQLTLINLAEKVQLNASDISRYERGLTIPSFDVACRLADALNVSLEAFRS